MMIKFFCFVLCANAMLGLTNANFNQPSSRSGIESFKVMDVLMKAMELEAKNISICHMEVGQPSTGAPFKVLEAAKHALDVDKIGYTSALGNIELRRKIAEHYSKKYKTEVAAERIVITTGSSAAFLFVFLGCFDVGDCVGLCSSGYPCYRNIIKATGLEHVSIPINKDFKITAKELSETIEEREQKKLPPLKGLILSSPSNPTGVMLSPTELKDLCEVCEKNDIRFISDEIYHGISYKTQKEASAVEFSKSAIIINSFSKYYSMTGWRLGWMVVPNPLVDAMNRLSQNLYINAPTLSQLAAVEAFNCDDELELHIERYARNREIVLRTLEDLQLLQYTAPSDGAFYTYVDVGACGINNTPEICNRLLEEAGVAITPGSDFEDPSSGLGLQRIRFSYSRSTEEVLEGMSRFSKWWKKNVPQK